jgi:hypothetical protein
MRRCGAIGYCIPSLSSINIHITYKYDMPNSFNRFFTQTLSIVLYFESFEIRVEAPVTAKKLSYYEAVFDVYFDSAFYCWKNFLVISLLVVALHNFSHSLIVIYLMYFFAKLIGKSLYFILSSERSQPDFANLSASSLPIIPECPFIQMKLIVVVIFR